MRSSRQRSATQPRTSPSRHGQRKRRGKKKDETRSFFGFSRQSVWGRAANDVTQLVFAQIRVFAQILLPSYEFKSQKNERGAAPDSPPARAREYAGPGVPAAVKEHTAHFAVALQGQGVPVETILKALADTYYAPKRRTLMEHMAAIKGDNAPLSTEKRQWTTAGTHGRAVGDYFWMGFAPTKNCTSRDRARWIVANLDVDVSLASVSRHKDLMGLSFQLVGRHGTAPGSTRDEYVLGYFEFVQRLHLELFFDFDPDCVICIDFVTNSQRREYEETLSIIGGKQNKNSLAAPLYTNSYIVGVSRGGGLDILSLMFTFDPTFDPNGSRKIRAMRVLQVTEER